jgi:gas vesicle protein
MTKMKETTCNKRPLLPFLLGGLGTGLALGLLLAPRSGRATRRSIDLNLRAAEDWAKTKVETGEEFLEAHGL